MFYYLDLDDRNCVVAAVASGTEMKDLVQVTKDIYDKASMLGSNAVYQDGEIYDKRQCKWDSDTNKWVVDESLEIAVLKQDLIDELNRITSKTIKQYYPSWKQQSDLADKDYHGAALLMINSSYTADQLYKQAGTYANEILDGTKTLNDIVSTLPQQEQPHWEQIIKSAARIAWLKRVKDVYWSVYNEITSKTSKTDLEQIDLNSIVFPKFPQF